MYSDGPGISILPGVGLAVMAWMVLLKLRGTDREIK